MKSIVAQITDLFGLRRKRLLVVDDEEPLRNLFLKFFSKRGFDVTVACDIAEAHQALEKGRFDVILHDIGLPDGSGLDSLTFIKAKYPDLPVFILTGLGYEEELLQAAIRQGAAGYLSKFVPLDQVLMEIHRVLKFGAQDANANRDRSNPDRA
jgi:DNA-binding NtrC family response regulator